MKNIAYGQILKTFANALEEAELNSKIIKPRVANIAIVDAKNQPSLRALALIAFDQQGFYFVDNVNDVIPNPILNSSKTFAQIWTTNFVCNSFIKKIKNMSKKTKFKDEFKMGFDISGHKDETLNVNKNVALCFYWGVLGRQVRIEGKIIEQKNLNQPSLGAFLVVPHAIEFWNEGKFRIHKRMKYQRINNIWQATRLYP